MSDTILPNPNTRRELLLREFSETTLPERSLREQEQGYARVRKRNFQIRVCTKAQQFTGENIKPCGVLL